MNQINTLNPILKKALNSLDLQLENELQKYRQKRRKQRAEGSLNSSYVAPAISTPLMSNNQPTPELMTLDSELDQDQAILSSISYSNDPNLTQSGSEEKTQIGRDLKLPNFESSQPSKSKIIARISLDQISSLIHQPQGEKASVAEVENKIPNQYLKSTEQLLASLQEEENTVKQTNQTNLKVDKNSSLKTSYFKYLTTPLGVGSLLLLFVSSALLSTVILAPESFSYLGLNNLFLGNQTPPQPDNLNNNNLTSNSTVVVPKGINLTNEEFTPIQLENLSTLDSNIKAPVAPPVNNLNPQTPTDSPPQTLSQTVPSPPPAPVLTNNEDLASVLLPPSLRPQNQTNFEVPTLPPAPNLKTDQATNQNLNQRYLVVIPFTGNNSLDQVRQVVKDAFVRDFPDGKKIQIATFDNQNEAEQFIQKLSRSGLSASVYTLANR